MPLRCRSADVNSTGGTPSPARPFKRFDFYLHVSRPIVRTVPGKRKSQTSCFVESFIIRGMDQKETWEVEIIRSAKRRKSVSAELKQGVLVVRAPAAMSDAELAPIIEKLRQRLAKRRQVTPASDDDLVKRAQALNKQFFNGRLRWQSIRYVTNQTTIFGSCTPSLGTIRISHRLREMPKWVEDYVIVHELAHLEEANHGPRFWQLVNQYPLTERARGYLMAVGMEEDEVGGKP